MDIKAKIEEIVNKLKNDGELRNQFTENPITVIEKLIGVDLPDDTVQKIVDGVKSKLSLDDIGGKLGGITGKLGGLFGK